MKPTFLKKNISLSSSTMLYWTKAVSYVQKPEEFLHSTGPHQQSRNMPKAPSQGNLRTSLKNWSCPDRMPNMDSTTYVLPLRMHKVRKQIHRACINVFTIYSPNATYLSALSTSQRNTKVFAGSCHRFVSSYSSS